MFKKNNQTMGKQPTIDTSAINIIRNGTEMTGDITCAGDIRIDGKVNGSLSSQGKVVIGETGMITGDITCKSADISGNIHGSIEVSELLQLKKTAKIEGEIQTQKLAIEPGADFTGSCQMANGSAPKMSNKHNQPIQKNKLKKETATVG